MSEILTERSGNILRVTVNRPAKKNAMTSAMYIATGRRPQRSSKGRRDTCRDLGCCGGFIFGRQ